MLSAEERQAYLFIIEQIRLAIRDLKEDNEKGDYNESKRFIKCYK